MRRVTLMFAALVLGACSEAAPGAAYDLSGYVTRTVGGGGIGGARVRFTSDTGMVSGTTTDSNGRYSLQVFSDVEFGQVRAEAEGFSPAEKTVYFDQPVRRIDIALQGAAP